MTDTPKPVLTYPKPERIDKSPSELSDFPSLTRDDFKKMLAALGVTLAVRQGAFLRKHELPYTLSNEHLLLVDNVDAMRFWLPERPNNFADCYFLPGHAMVVRDAAILDPARIYGLYIHYTLNEAKPVSIGDPKDVPAEAPHSDFPPFHRGNFLQFAYGNSAAAMNHAATLIWRFFLDRQFSDMGHLLQLEDHISFPADLNTHGEVYQVNTVFVPKPVAIGPTPEYVARFRREQDRIHYKLDREEQETHPPEDSI